MFSFRVAFYSSWSSSSSPSSSSPSSFSSSPSSFSSSPSSSFSSSSPSSSFSSSSPSSSFSSSSPSSSFSSSSPSSSSCSSSSPSSNVCSSFLYFLFFFSFFPFFFFWVRLWARSGWGPKPGIAACSLCPLSSFFCCPFLPFLSFCSKQWTRKRCNRCLQTNLSHTDLIQGKHRIERTNKIFPSNAWKHKYKWYCAIDPTSPPKKKHQGGWRDFSRLMRQMLFTTFCPISRGSSCRSWHIPLELLLQSDLNASNRLGSSRAQFPKLPDSQINLCLPMTCQGCTCCESTFTHFSRFYFWWGVDTCGWCILK